MNIRSMLEVCVCDEPLDPFAIAHRVLKLCNCNSEPLFEATGTRVPVPGFARDARVKAFAAAYGSDPVQVSEPVNAGDRLVVVSDHLARDFVVFELPKARGRAPPAVDPEADFRPECHWFCDVPSTLMRPEPKVYMSEALNPTLEKPLPVCCVCGSQLTYPFWSSLKHEVCGECLASGRLPQQTTTLDFFEVFEPEPGVGWSVEETNQLIKLVEDNGDNWAEISSLMKTRTPAECLIHFMRLPMYDQYYIADPLAVPAGEIPSDGKMLPFMIAPDPISAFVFFVHEFDSKLGSVVAEASERHIKEILSSKSGVMLFDRVPDIIRSLLQLVGERAGQLAVEEGTVMLSTLREVVRLLQNEITYQFRALEGHMKDVQEAQLRT